jgi:hypothetical protein
MTDAAMVERRMLLRGAGVAGATLVGVAAAAAPASANSEGHDVLGAWFVTHTDEPPSETDPGTSVVGFGSGGLMTTQDLYPIGAAGIGTWEPDGGDDFKGKFWTGFPGPDNGPGGFIKISVHGSVDGDRIKGRYHGWVYVAATMALEGEFKGRFKGKRVEV